MQVWHKYIRQRGSGSQFKMIMGQDLILRFVREVALGLSLLYGGTAHKYSYSASEKVKARFNLFLIR